MSVCVCLYVCIRVCVCLTLSLSVSHVEKKNKKTLASPDSTGESQSGGQIMTVEATGK